MCCTWSPFSPLQHMSLKFSCTVQNRFLEQRKYIQNKISFIQMLLRWPNSSLNISLGGAQSRASVSYYQKQTVEDVWATQQMSVSLSRFSGCNPQGKNPGEDAELPAGIIPCVSWENLGSLGITWWVSLRNETHGLPSR